jgi:hypothetical protein
MFTAYIDDSGTAPEHKVAMATALVIPAKNTARFESDWKIFIEKWKISDFHTSECAAANERSEYAGWSEEKRKKFLSRVRQVIKRYGVRSYSLSVKKSDYEAVVPVECRTLFGQHYYTYAVHNLLSVLDSWACATGVEHPIEYVFDWMVENSPERREIEESIARSEAARPGRFTHWSFRIRQQTPGLQCVDLIGWTCYRDALNTHGGPPLSPLQIECKRDLNNWKNGEWLTALGQTQQQIREAAEFLKEYDGKLPLQVRPHISG